MENLYIPNEAGTSCIAKTCEGCSQVFSQDSHGHCICQQTGEFLYEAFGISGVFWRAARKIWELPGHARGVYLDRAAEAVSKTVGLPLTGEVCFGVPIFLSFGLNLAEAKNHSFCDLLMTKGCDLPVIHIIDDSTDLEKAQALGFESIEDCKSHQEWVKKVKAHSELCFEACRTGRALPQWNPEP